MPSNRQAGFFVGPGLLRAGGAGVDDKKTRLNKAKGGTW